MKHYVLFNLSSVAIAANNEKGAPLETGGTVVIYLIGSTFPLKKSLHYLSSYMSGQAATVKLRLNARAQELRNL